MIASSNLSFHSSIQGPLESFSVAGIAMISTSVKQNDDFMIEKLNTSRPLLKMTTRLPLQDHVKTTGHNIKWDHFGILTSGKPDYHCKIKETLLIQELKPAFNVNVTSEKLML